MNGWPQGNRKLAGTEALLAFANYFLGLCLDQVRFLREKAVFRHGSRRSVILNSWRINCISRDFSSSYVTATEILPSRRDRGAGLTMILMSWPSLVRHSIRFFSDTPRNRPRCRLANLGREKPGNTDAANCVRRRRFT